VADVIRTYCKRPRVTVKIAEIAAWCKGEILAPADESSSRGEASKDWRLNDGR
jgi:hypothetical protein